MNALTSFSRPITQKGEYRMEIRKFFGLPARLIMAAAVIALLLCLLPARVNAPEPTQPRQAETAQLEPRPVPAAADLSERTGSDAWLHRTLCYVCGHSVQRREKLDARLVGLSRSALDQALPSVLPGACVTGFSAGEVDISLRRDIPCPLHWVLKTGDDGMLSIWQNRTGEEMEPLRSTDVPARAAPEEEQDALREGMLFDDIQALEGYLESLSS